MNRIYMLFALLLLLGGASTAQVQVTGGSTATYTSVNAAFAAINAGTHTGVILIDIMGSTTEPSTPTPLAASGQGSASYTSIILRPSFTATISGAMVTGRGVLELDGADNVMIDGDIAGGSIGKDLTIENSAANTVANTAAIRYIGRTTLGLGAINNTVQNCIIVGNTPGNDGTSGSTVASSYGIYAGSNGATLVSNGAGDNYDNLTILNNDFQRAYFGLWVGGTTTGTADNILISGNIFGSTIAGRTLSNRGIYLNNVTNSTVTLNEVFNLKVTTSVTNAGIDLIGTPSSSVTISRNKIYGIWSTNTSGVGAYGISLNGGNNHLCVNNVIYDIKTANYSATSITLNAFGIRVASGTGHKIYYNSVNMFGNYAGGGSVTASAAFLVSTTGVTGLEIKNNIFNNIMTSSTATTQKFMAVWFPAGYNFFNATLDNNAYTVTNDAFHFVGKIGTTSGTGEYATLPLWQPISQINNPVNDIASVPLINAGAPFVSNTNLNIPNNTIHPIESGATIIPSLGLPNIDFTGVNRPQTGINPNVYPDMGAYEYDGLAGSSNDVGVLSLPSPAPAGCYSSSENIVVTLKNFGATSVSNIPVTVIVSGAVTQTTNATYTAVINAGTTASFTVGTVNMSAAGTYSFDAYTALTGDPNLINDSMAVAIRTVTPISAIPTVVDFTGYTGANLTALFPVWYEAAGVTMPMGTTSNWLNQTNLNGAGNITIKLNMYGTIRNEWIVGPKFLATANSQIDFDAAVTNYASTTVGDLMGSDDKVRLMISTDCGASFTPIFTVSATNSLSTTFTNFQVPLGAYAGQNIIVAFLAQDGPVDDPEDYDFHLDNINIYNTLPNDALPSALVSPAASGCYSANENLTVAIKNNGTASISNIPVTVVVSGAATQTSTSTYTGSIAAGATANFVVGTLNMTTPGTYSFTAYTALPGDLVPGNDTLAMLTRTVNPTVALTQTVNFTGFTGANLTTVFPNWYEGSGVGVPIGTTSNWVNQTNLNGAGNVTIRLNLYTTTRNEWIIGPKFTATSGSNIEFDAAVTNFGSTTVADVMGSDDKVRVMVSTNCGASFAPIFTISATNSLSTTFTNFQVPLGAYAGQDIIVAFLAQDGPVDDPEDYDFHIDNINLYNSAATDAMPTALISPLTSGCYSANENLTVVVKNNGTASISNIPVNVVVSGAVTQTSTTNYTNTIAPGATANVVVGTLNMTTAGVYSFKAYTSLAGDLIIANDTATVFTRTVNPTVSLPQNVSFNLFNGTNLSTAVPNWYEATGVTVPTGSTSAWVNQSNFNLAGNVNARLNMYGTARNEWIVGPKFTATSNSNINFDAAVTNLSSLTVGDLMGSDDKVRVMVSTDCGISFAPIFTVSATNSLSTTFTNFQVPLGAYAGQNIIVAFLAQDGPTDDVEDYDFHLDNINLYNGIPADAGAVLTAPISTGCYSASENVVVDITNYGTAPISNVPVSVNINGPIPQVINSTYPGTLAIGATASFTVGAANMSAGGTYTFLFNTVLSGDINTFNDGSILTRTVSPITNILGNTFLCSGGTATLNASGSAVSYSWSTGAITSSVVVSPTTTTVYTLIGFSAASCTTALTQTVTVTTPTITGNGALFCGASGTGTLTAASFAPVNWYATPTSTVSLATGNTYVPPAASTNTTFYIESNSSSNGTLTTTMAGGNGLNGNMFDIFATKNLIIDGFDMNIDGPGTSTVEVWYRPGSFVGFESSNAGWTQILTTTVSALTAGNLTTVPSTLNLNVPAGQTYAFYVTTNGGPQVKYTNGSTLGNLYNSNSDIQLFEGKGGSYFSVTNSPRVFNGQVRYTAAGCISPRIPVTLSVSPSPSLSVSSTGTALCSGQSTTLTANGATTYTWSSGTMSATTVETPTVNTTYSVTAENSGCFAMDSVAVTVAVTPTIFPVSSTSVLCSGSSATLSVSGATSYTWSTGSMATGIIVSPTVTTSYTVTGTNGNNCNDIAVITQTVTICTGIDNVTTTVGEVNVYPNPNHGLLNVVIDNVSNKPVFELYDAFGKLIISQELSDEKTSIVTSQLPGGVYIYKIRSESGFVKQGKLIRE